MQIRPLVYFLFVLSASQSACSRIDNSWDTARFHCGETVTDSYRYVTVPGEDLRLSDAVGIEGGQVQSFKILNNSCIEIPMNFKGELLYRSSQESQKLDLGSLPQLAFFEVKSAGSLEKIHEFFKCADNAIHTGELLQLELNRQQAANYSYFLHNLRIFDQNDNPVVETKLGSLPLPISNFGLDDGVYQLQVQSADVFELAKGIVSYNNSCRLILDRTAPLVQSSLEQNPLLRDELFQLNAGQNISFVIDDLNPKSIYYCLASQEDQNSCQDQQNFRLVDDIVPAPQDGIWKLYYFAEDQAGNRSATQTESFAVYHPQEVELIRKTLLNSALYGLANRAQEGMDTFQQALQDYDALSLDEERQALYWDLIGSFWRLEENVSLRYKLNLADISQIWADPYSQRYIAATNGPIAYLIEGQNIHQIDDAILEISFLANGDFAYLNYSSEFVVVQAGEYIRVTSPVRRGGISSLPDGTWLVHGSEGLFKIDLPALQAVQIRELESRITGFGPSFFISEDQNYLTFYNRNLIEIIELRDNPGLKPSYSLTLDSPCGITNVYFHSLEDVFIVGRFSATIGRSQGGLTEQCGIVRWNPLNENFTQYKYSGEIGFDYMPESSFFRKKAETLSLVIHNRIGPAFYFGVHWLGQAWGLQSNIGWGLTQVGSSFNQLDRVRPSFSHDYIINTTDRDVAVTPTPYPFLDQSPIFRYEIKAVAAEMVNHETDIVLASEGELGVHSVVNSMQGQLSLVDTEDVDTTLFSNSSQVLFAHDGNSGFSFDWAKQQLIFHDEYLRRVRSLALSEVPSSLAYWQGHALWSSRSGQIFHLPVGSDSPVVVAEGFDFVKRIEVAGDLSRLVIIDVNDTNRQDRLSFLRQLPDGAYQIEQPTANSLRPIAFRRSPSNDSFLFASELEMGSYEIYVYDLDFNLVKTLQHPSNQVYYRADGQSLIYTQDGNFVVASLHQPDSSQIAISSSVQGQSISRIVANDQYIYFTTAQGVFRQDSQGALSSLTGLTDLSALHPQFLLAMKGPNNLVLVDPESLTELAGTRFDLPIRPELTTLKGSEIFVFGHDRQKRRFSVRRLSLDPDNIRKAMHSWSR